jgi:lysine-N-methylase
VESRVESSTNIVFDEGQRYKCEHCPARCCRFSWGIPVTQEEYQRYHKTPWIKERLQQQNTDFVPLGDLYQLPRVQLPDGDYGCVFLDKDNLCMIQKQEGHAFIPGTCQTYPFGFLEKKELTSGNTTIYPVTSYFCPSVLQNYGEPLADLVQPLYERHKAKNLVTKLPDAITLGNLSLGHDTYTAFSDWLLRLLTKEDLPIPQVLMQARQLSVELLTQYPTQETLTPDAIQTTIDAFKGTECEATPEITRNSFAGRAMIATRILISTRQYAELHQEANKGKSNGKLETWNMALQEKKLLAQMIEEKGHISFWDQSIAIDMKKAKLVELKLGPDFQRELKRYFHHLVQSQQIFTQNQNLLKILFLLACNYASILRATRYVAYAYGRTTAQTEDLKAAIGYVDAAYTNQARQTNMRMSAQEVILDFLSAMNSTFERVLFCESY